MLRIWKFLLILAIGAIITLYGALEIGPRGRILLLCGLYTIVSSLCALSSNRLKGRFTAVVAIIGVILFVVMAKVDFFSFDVVGLGVQMFLFTPLIYFVKIKNRT